MRLDEPVVGGLGEHDDLVADVQDEGVEQLLGLFPGEGPFGDLLLGQGAQEPVDESGAVRPVDAVGDEQVLVEEEALDALPERAGRMLHDPVAALGHLQQLRLARGILRLGGLLAAALGVALAHEDHAVADLDVGPVEELAADVLRRGVLPDGIQLFLGDLPAFTEGDHDRPLIAGAEMAGEGSAHAAAHGAALGHEILREEAHGCGGDVVVLPEFRRLQDPGPVLIRDPDAARHLPGGPETLVRVPEAALDPGRGSLLDVEVDGAAVGTSVSQEDIVVVDIDLPGGEPGVQVARPLQDGVLVHMGLVVLRDDAVALKVQTHILIDAFALLLQLLDAWGKGIIKVLHGYAPFAALFSLLLLLSCFSVSAPEVPGR